MSDKPGFFKELVLFARYYWWWWLTPIVLTFLVVALVAIAGSGSESGFTYDLF